MSYYLSSDTKILQRKSGGTDCAFISFPATLDGQVSASANRDFVL